MNDRTDRLEAQAKAWSAANEAIAVYLTSNGIDVDDAYDAARELMDLADDRIEDSK